MMLYYALRNELWKMFGKKRTYIGFVMFFLAQAAIVVLMRYTHGPRRQMANRLDLMGYDVDEYISWLTIATGVLVPVAYVLLPLYVSLVGGDLLAKEAEDGTLRMMLSRPISRLRIVTVKWMAGAIFSLLLVGVLAVFGILVSAIFFKSGGLFAMIPMDGIFSIFDSHEGMTRYILASTMLGLKAVTIMGLAWMFSCFNIKPAAATILSLSVFLVSRIIQEIPFFHDLQGWFISYHLNLWMEIFQQQIPWPAICESASVLFGFNLTFFIIGCAAFQMRDIKS